MAAATRGAVAVIDGNVMAINPGEEAKMQMFIWNNIFFSLGFDVRDHYKELGGDAAAFVAPRNDLQGVRVYAAVDLPGLYTLGTVVIDYRCVFHISSVLYLLSVCFLISNLYFINFLEDTASPRNLLYQVYWNVNKNNRWSMDRSISGRQFSRILSILNW